MEFDEIIIDSDTAFDINTVSRDIIKTSLDKVIVQGDHNSERFTFVMSRYVEGHDMLKCDKIEIHFINIDLQDKANQSKDIFKVKDAKVDENDENKIVFTWLLDGNATRYAGTLAFIVRFSCLDGDVVTYAWHTNISQDIVISKGMCLSEDIFEEHLDILEQWKLEVLSGFNYLTEFFKPLPKGANIDEIYECGYYLGWEDITGGTSPYLLIVAAFEANHPDIGGLVSERQIKLSIEKAFDANRVSIKQRCYDYYTDEEGEVKSKWFDWKSMFATNISDGVIESSLRDSSSLQSLSSQAGAKAFTFTLKHVYTDEDIANKRYYLYWATDKMLNKPFSIVLGENYDFVGTITGVGKDEDYGYYITVDNYIAPSTTDNRYMIDKDSYILLPYDTIEDGGTYVPFDYYMNNGAHLLGYNSIGKGATGLGYKCYALSDGAFSAGYMNISAGKHSGTLGRFNVTGYCDFAFGQDLKLLGHWQGGLGRDIFMSNVADYSFGAGLQHEIRKRYCSVFGRGHIMTLDDSSARGRYSDAGSSGYIDRVGYGSGPNDRKNIYTLDRQGNAWFQGDLRIGGTKYDDASRVAKTTRVEAPSNLLTLTDAKLGDTVICHGVVYKCQLGENYVSNGLDLWTNSDNPAGDAYGENVVIGGKPCRKSGYFKDIVADTTRWQKMIYLNLPAYDADNTYRKIDIKFSYYDIGEGSIAIRHSAVGTTGVNISVATLTNSKEWKEAVVSIDEMKFNNGLNGQDFRFFCSNGINMYISDVSVFIREEYANSDTQYITKEVYMLASDDKDAYKDAGNWVLINK